MIQRFSPFTQRVFWLATGTALGQGAFLILSPLLSRLYSPHDFGGFSVFMAIVPMLAPFFTLRYEIAVPLPEKDEEAATLTMLCIILAVLCGVVLTSALLFFPFGSAVAGWMGISYALLLWMPLSACLLSFQQTMSSWAIRRMDYMRLSLARLLTGGLGTVAQLGAGGLGVGAAGLVVGDAIGRGASSMLLGDGLRRHLPPWQPSRFLEVAYRFRRFAWLNLPDTLVSTAVLNLPTLMVSHQFGMQEAGWFGLVGRLLSAPAGLVGQAIGQVYLGHAADLHRRQHSIETLATRLLLKLFAGLSLPFLLFGMVLLPLGIHWLFGPEWHPAASLAYPVCVWYWGGLIIAPLSHTLNILQRQHWLLLWNLLRLTGTAGLFLVAKVYSISLLPLLWMMGTFHFLTYIVLAVIILRSVRLCESDRM